MLKHNWECEQSFQTINNPIEQYFFLYEELQFKVGTLSLCGTNQLLKTGLNGYVFLRRE